MTILQDSDQPPNRTALSALWPDTSAASLEREGIWGPFRGAKKPSPRGRQGAPLGQ